MDNKEKAVIDNFKPSAALKKALSKLADGPQSTFILDELDIKAIHDAYIDEFGGDYGIRDVNLFKSVCLAPYQACFGQELYPTIFDKAAKYIIDFARYQIFIDGNKRTGLAAAECFLENNGYTMNLSSEQFYILTMDIANNNIEDSKVVEMIKNNVLFYDVEMESEEEYDEIT